MIGLLVAILGPLLKISLARPPVPHGATGVRIFKASPRYLSYKFLIAWISFLPVALPVIAVAAVLHVASRRSEVPVWISIGLPAFYGAVVLFFFALTLVSIQLDYEMHCYVVTDRSIRIRQGIWEQIEATLTYANVQNVRVEQGPLERFFGIASVVVDTAGGASKQGSGKAPMGIIRGIEDAAALRDRIMEKMKASKSSGLGDPDDPDHGHAHDADHLPAELLRAIRDEARALAAAASAR